MHKLQRTLAALLCTGLAVLSVFVANVVLATPAAATGTPALVMIHQVGPAWHPGPGFLTYRHSHLVYTYEDLAGDQPWHYSLAYRNCPVTNRGAVRLTLYRTILANHGRLPPDHAARYKQLYSHTLVLKAASGGAEYEFPGHDETDFFIWVNVLSPRGCASWTYAGETN